MGARPSSFKSGGGGFLNGTDGVITDYQWTDEFNGEAFKPGKMKTSEGKTIDRPHSLNLFLSVRVDGATEDTTTTLKAAGVYEDYEVSDDGHTLTAADGGECNISSKSATGKFLASLVEAGFPEANFSEDPNSIDLTPMIGTRVRTVQRRDAERTKEFGKKKAKNGKEYDRTDLVVDQVYDVPSATPATKSGPKAVAGKAAPKAAKGKAATAAVNNTEAVKTLATETLVNVVDEAGGSIAKQKLSVRLLLALKGHDLREDVRKYVFNDDNLDALAEEGYITYDRSTGTISKAA